MAALSLSIDAIKPLNRWDHSSIRPGIVGSVGDCLISERLKSTFPGDFRWNPMTVGSKASFLGSSISNGAHTSFVSGGGPAKLIDRNWASGRRFQTKHGWYYQDMRAPDKRIEPTVGSLPQYTWRNRIARIENQRKTGNLFQHGGMNAPDGITRGGQVPRVTDVVGGDTPPEQINAGPTLLNPNFHPHLSSHTATGMEDHQAEHHRRGTLGRIRR